MWEEHTACMGRMSNAHFTEFGRKLGRMYHLEAWGTWEECIMSARP
jgi:hypothetical protein